MQQILGLLAVERTVAQVDEREVHVGAAGEDGDALLGDIGAVQTLGQQRRAEQGALLTFLEFGRRGDLESDGLGGDGVHQRSALLAGEHRGVELLGPLLLRQDHAGARAAKGLVDSGGHDVRVRDRRGVHTGGDEPGEVRHVDPEERADLVRDGAESLEVLVTRVCRPPCDEYLRLGLDGLLAHLVHVDAVVFLADAVRLDLVELAGEVELHAVCEVTAVREIEAHDLVAGVDQCHQHCGVGLRTCMRLDVGELGAEELLGAVAREVLHDVDVLAAAVVATTRVSLGVLVGQHAALSLQHRAGHEVLGRDHLEGVALTAELTRQRLGDLGVEFGERQVVDVSHKGGLQENAARWTWTV